MGLSLCCGLQQNAHQFIEDAPSNLFSVIMSNKVSCPEYIVPSTRLLVALIIEDHVIKLIDFRGRKQNWHGDHICEVPSCLYKSAKAQLHNHSYFSSSSLPGPLDDPGQLLWVSALHYSAGSWVSEGFWTVASAHVLCQPTIAGPSIS